MPMHNSGAKTASNLLLQRALPLKLVMLTCMACKICYDTGCNTCKAVRRLRYFVISVVSETHVAFVPVGLGVALDLKWQLLAWCRLLAYRLKWQVVSCTDIMASSARKNIAPAAC